MCWADALLFSASRIGGENFGQDIFESKKNKYINLKTISYDHKELK